MNAYIQAFVLQINAFEQTSFVHHVHNLRTNTYTYVCTQLYNPYTLSKPMFVHPCISYQILNNSHIKPWNKLFTHSHCVARLFRSTPDMCIPYIHRNAYTLRALNRCIPIRSNRWIVVQYYRDNESVWTSDILSLLMFYLIIAINLVLFLC